MTERVPTTMEERMQAWGVETAPKTELTLDEYLAARPAAPEGWTGRDDSESAAEVKKHEDGRLLGDFSYNDLSLAELTDLRHDAMVADDRSTQGEALAYAEQKISNGEVALADVVEVARLAKDDTDLRDVAMAGIHNRLLAMVNEEKMTFEAAIARAEAIDTLIKRSDEQIEQDTSEVALVDGSDNEAIVAQTKDTPTDSKANSSAESLAEEPASQIETETPVDSADIESQSETEDGYEDIIELNTETMEGIVEGMSLVAADQAARRYKDEMLDKGVIVNDPLLDSQVHNLSSDRLGKISKELKERSRKKRIQKMLGRFSLRRLFKRSAA